MRKLANRWSAVGAAILVLGVTAFVACNEAAGPTAPEAQYATDAATAVPLGGEPLLAQSSALACSEQKVSICHVPPGNPDNRHEVCISESAVPSHLDHGDYPVSPEVCDGIDNDCDGVVDDLDELEPLGLSYFYSFQSMSGTATVLPGDTFTIWDQPGGCGPDFNDTAECRTNCLRQVRAYNHDCASRAEPGTLGPWVSQGCSTAEEFGFVVECCVP